MTNTGCWTCHHFAPGGVCVGPHPEYDHKEAVHRRHVINGDGVHVLAGRERLHPIQARPFTVRGSMSEALRRIREQEWERTPLKDFIPASFSGKAREQLGRRPWGLYRDGLPVGWFATSEEAVAAVPLGEVRVIEGEGGAS